MSKKEKAKKLVDLYIFAVGMEKKIFKKMEENFKKLREILVEESGKEIIKEIIEELEKLTEGVYKTINIL